MRVLVTGGAGFLGSHLVNRLVARGDEVSVIDSLETQVHAGGRPGWLDIGARYYWADFREAPDDAIGGVFDAVVHLAAATGTGQSMYEGAAYTRANAELTAHFADLLIARQLRADRVVFASSRAIYGEGTRVCAICGRVRPGPRSEADAMNGEWEPRCPTCGGPTTWTSTKETDEARPLSVYGATKLFGETVLDLTASTSMPPVTSLRFFNLYGSRQSPANPYVGVASTFAALALAGKPLTIFEDGGVLRDFLHVQDAVDAIESSIDRADPFHGVINVGSGLALSLIDLADQIAATAGRSLSSLGYQINGRTRAGDLRACIADIGRADRELGWRPRVDLGQGLSELLAFIEGVPMVDPAAATAEMERRGLLIGRR